MKRIAPNLRRSGQSVRPIAAPVIRADAGGARRVNSWLSIRNEEDDSKPVELLIYDQIGKDWWDNSGVDARTFAEALAEIDAKRKIIVAINSPGGNVWDGLAIFNRLETRKKYVTTRIDGIAASIASVIALAGSDVQIPRNALMMIHDPSGLVVGTADDMRQLAEQLDIHADVLADIYAEKAGGTVKEWRAKMREETWFTGTEAKEAGLADTVLGEITVRNTFDLSRCRNVPAALQAQQNNNNQPSRRAANPPPDPMKRKEILALFASLSVIVAADAADAVLLAELQKLCAAGKVTAEKFEELTGQKPAAIAPAPTPTPAPALAPAPAPGPAPAAAVASAAPIDPNRILSLEANYRRERERRLTGEFNAVVAENPAIRRDTWLPRLLATVDDAQSDALLADLRALPAPNAGVDPVAPSLIVLGNPLLDKYADFEPGPERARYRLQNFRALQRVRREFGPRGPQNVNTFDAALTTDFLADAVITTANNRLAALAGFSQDFGTDPLKPAAVVQVEKVTGTSAAQTNPANFETGDTTVDNIPVTVALINKGFHITQAEANNGHRLEKLALKNSHTFVNAISDIWTAILQSPPYADEVIGASAAFDAGTLADIYGFAKNFSVKNLIIDGAYKGQIVARINPQAFKPAPQGEQGTFGFDLLAEQNRWTGAIANTVGIVAAPDGIAAASGLPIENLDRSEFVEVRTVTIDPLGLTVIIHIWGSRAGRVRWASYDVMFGAAAGDETQLTILKSA